VAAISQLLELDHVLIAFDTEYSCLIGEETMCWGTWQSQCLHSPVSEKSEWAPSSHILNLLKKDKATVYQIPEVRTESLMKIKSLVASPLKNAQDDVIGVIYGDREMSVSNQVGFLQTEAMFVELFANGISLGLERLKQERKMSEMRARFDQFFTPSLARQLESDASMLEPRSAQVSILFADIRGFSRISERIGPEKTINWINSVMSLLSDCVFDHDGVVVDYIGDEIMAMWGAPADQANHSELAVRAAIDMRARLPDINRQWEEIVGEPVEIGIGINSGEAQVGNTGSERKFKYGPLGDVVNVGSRLQGATKQLKAKLLITEECAAALPTDILRRRIRSVRFVNVKRAVTVFEVPFEPDQNWNELQQEYEEGLNLYETGEMALASQKMASVVAQWKDDGPSMLLLSDSVKWLQLDIEKFDPVWQLYEK
jgi:adenylate cyclase